MSNSRGFSMNYKTYSGPRGNPDDWRQAFTDRMGLPEAKRRVGKETPESILGVRVGASWSEIRSAYKAAALKNHPDRATMNGMTVEEATEKFKKVVAAYTVLEDRERRR